MKRKSSRNTGVLRRRPNGMWELHLCIGANQSGKMHYRSVYDLTAAGARRKGGIVLAALHQDRNNITE